MNHPPHYLQLRALPQQKNGSLQPQKRKQDIHQRRLEKPGKQRKLLEVASPERP